MIISFSESLMVLGVLPTMSHIKISPECVCLSVLT